MLNSSRFLASIVLLSARYCRPCSFAPSTSLVGLLASSSVSCSSFALKNPISPPTTTSTTRKMTSESTGLDDEASGLKDIGGVGNSLKEDHPESGTEILKSWRTWMEISSAKTRKIRGSNYVQLATVDEQGRPRCRTVVFRGFVKLPEDHPLDNRCDGESCLMRMITDRRSRKVEQVTKNNSESAELVWWFPKTTEQYRVTGRLIFVGSGEFEYDRDKSLSAARKEMWGNLSDSAREQFFDDRNPGETFTGDPVNIPPGGRDGNGTVLPPPDNFLLMILSPTEVDYLRLQNMYRQSDKKEGEWKSFRLNP